MPTIDENRSWGDPGRWDRGGDDWSDGYGGPDSQWYGSILPRIHAFVPVGSALEIACGHGRWTRYLQGLATELST